MKELRTALLHYSSPPVVGGVEAVIGAHAGVLKRAGYPVCVISGRGTSEALPEGVAFEPIPEMDSQDPSVLSVSKALEEGRVPAEFQALTSLLLDKLERKLAGFDALIVHNVFTKHFNLPLTAALSTFLERHESVRCLAWCHDFTWTSAHSRSRVHEGYPWDLLRERVAHAIYVTISERRRSELAELLGCAEAEVAVVPGATHLFEEPGALPAVAELAREWFVGHFTTGAEPGVRRSPRGCPATRSSG